MKVQLLYVPDCPNLDACRAALREALAAENVDVAVEEIDVDDPDAPTWARGWGSPTILVDGVDVAGATRSDGSACRIYANGAPGVAAIRARLAAARSSGHGRP